MRLALQSEDIVLGALLILAEFIALAFLGFLLVQLMHWETQLQNNGNAWLAGLRNRVRQLRALRRQLDKTGGEWPEIPMGPSLRRKWTVARWVCKALSAAKWARS
jgi:hypothetical protein